MAIIHKNLATGRWQKLTLVEQMGNIGSEVSRARLAEGRDAEGFDAAVDRALELFDLTLADSRWRGRQREIARAREVLCDAVTGGVAYKSTLEDIDHYLFEFALLVRKNT